MIVISSANQIAFATSQPIIGSVEVSTPGRFWAAANLRKNCRSENFSEKNIECSDWKTVKLNQKNSLGGNEMNFSRLFLQHAGPILTE